MVSGYGLICWLRCVARTAGADMKGKADGKLIRTTNCHDNRLENYRSKFTYICFLKTQSMRTLISVLQ